MTLSDKQYNKLTPGLALQLAAPHTWAASLCPALFSVFYCMQQGIPLTIPRAVLTVAACVLLQSSVNTLNDYFDFVKGADSEEDNVEVSDAAIVYGGIDPKHALYLGLGYMAAGALAGIIALVGKGPVPIVLGIIGVLVIVLYSGGPMPISYLPVGEIVSGCVMGGLIPLGIAACGDGRFHAGIIPYSLPLVIGIALIMMSNNGCDIEKDIRAGRKTLPVMLGRNKTLEIYRTLIISWVTLAAVLPLTAAGPAGLVGTVLTGAGAWFAALPQMRMELLPEGRIAQMKGILKCNILLNGAYILAFAAGLVLQRL